MTDYYEILEIDRNATAATIRAAYKRLAMRYHPDRNAGDKKAEEHFKRINEAYHVLSDPVKKSQYDYQPAVDYQTTVHQAYYQELRRRRYQQWQQTRRDYRYKLDRNYYRMQGLAFLVFLAISGVCFSIMYLSEYFTDRQRQAEWRRHTEQLEKVNGLFNEGQYDRAFAMIHSLQQEEPLEYRFYYARDSLIASLREAAQTRYDDQHFGEAVRYYGVLKIQEDPPTFETLNRLALCQYFLGNYEESVRDLKQLYVQQPWNLELVYRLGMANLEKTHQPEEALQYFNAGKQLFKHNFTEAYGKAFMLMMDPNDAPEIYYALFIGRARANIALHHYDEAITDCNWAVFLRRDRSEGYRLRAEARIGMKQYADLCTDINAARRYGDADMDPMFSKYCSMP